MISDAVLLSIVASAVGLIGGIATLCFKYCFASKCSRVRLCWGCYETIRDTTHEVNNIETIKTPLLESSIQVKP